MRKCQCGYIHPDQCLYDIIWDCPDCKHLHIEPEVTVIINDPSFNIKTILDGLESQDAGHRKRASIKK